jgi:dUTP pyrophosphatase
MYPIEWKKVDPAATIPTRATREAAGWDLYCAADTLVEGGVGNVVIPTGVAVHLPPGTYGRIAMRSGLAAREHLTVSAGVVDRDYTGAIGVVASCTKIGHSYAVKRGERCAQLVVEMIHTGDGVEVEQFTAPPSYDHAGWGSTGKK